MYKVFVNDKVLILTDDYSSYSSDYDTLFIRYSDAATLKSMIKLLEMSDVVKTLCIYFKDLDILWNNFQSQYKVVEAAGGVVHKDNKILFIQKNGHWDLPKGKIEKGENIEKCALREVEEECGLSDLNVEESMESSYYVYKENNEQVLKQTIWYRMTASSDGPLKGDEKEGITDVRWMNSDEWNEAQKESYPSVIQLLSSSF